VWHAWHRRERETTAAYQAFRAYLILGSLDQVGHALYPGAGSRRRGKCGVIERWSTRFAWAERRRAWLAHGEPIDQRTLARSAQRRVERERLQLARLLSGNPSLRELARRYAAIVRSEARGEGSGSGSGSR
jgi:hypothetical protein